MPEGPEVRKYADLLAQALNDEPLASIWARTQNAKAWLAAHPDTLPGRRVVSVRSHGKNLIGTVKGGYFFYCHLMMWGRWQVFAAGDVPQVIDRRERARVSVANGATAVLLSAPVFEVGQGDPYAQFEHLRALGPDVLPYSDAPPFDEHVFVARLLAPEHRERALGAVLLDQTLVAGIGNYLRAEILFVCGLDPWKRAADLTGDELARLARAIPELAARAYATGGVTVPDTQRERLRTDPALVYPNAVSDFAKRHFVFRRTNLPCLVCATPIRQKWQVTHVRDDGGEKERIIYFCPQCQNTTVDLAPARKRTRKAAAPAGLGTSVV